ncbi:hypothetical protein ACFY93_21590 [Streptomyces sp. NPDC008313]|uniref:hypothetical protein n=1 Tax=Streptomyces sp. NPDC008313 TaxID=3364826 RepID=UPI0036EFB730
MTQSGQGEEPSAQPAREGIVLPSDGSAPLLPGTAGDRPADGHAVPAGGQTWGQPWGPGQPQQPERSDPSAQAPQPAYGWGTPGDGWGGQGGQGGGYGYPPQQTGGAGPLPPEGAQPSSYAPGGYPAHPGAGAPGHTPAHSAPLPPAADEGATQFIPPVAAGGPEGATQYLPPVPPAPDEGATQYIPPVGPGALPPETPSDATQYLGRGPQGAAGPLPHTADHAPHPASHPDAEATRFMAPVPGQPGGGRPYGTAPGGPDDRQPPAEFDNLFRDGSGPAGGATQQMPRFTGPDQAQAQAAPAPAPYAPQGPGGRAARRTGSASDGGGRGGRTGSRVPLIAAVGVGIAVLGIGAGALLSGGGGGDGDQDDDSTTVSATAPASEESASPSADPAKEQAVALDKLLADSNNSRESVVNAVTDVRACKNLGTAAADLRNAAEQRGGLVTRLTTLSVDKLPAHAELTAALTSAWKASASADNHYAAWADQTAGKHGCKKGHARTTGQTAAGNKASGTASAQKVKAAKLWNAIAAKYGLTQRQPTQL